MCFGLLFVGRLLALELPQLILSLCEGLLSLLEFGVFQVGRLQLEVEPASAVGHDVDQLEDLAGLDLVLTAE